MGRPRTVKQPKTCPRCQQEFIPKEPDRTFCGRRCAQTRDLPWKDCAKCGKPFRKSNEYSYAVWETIRFCSRRCMGASRQRLVKTCAHCGADFTTSHASRDQYCSRECFSIYQRTERFPVAGPRYKKTFTRRQKRLLLERDKACRSCGTTENLEYDHVEPIFQGGSNTIANGQVLCRPCHRAKTTAELRAAAS